MQLSIPSCTSDWDPIYRCIEQGESCFLLVESRPLAVLLCVHWRIPAVNRIISVGSREMACLQEADEEEVQDHSALCTLRFAPVPCGLSGPSVLVLLALGRTYSILPLHMRRASRMHLARMKGPGFLLSIKMCPGRIQSPRLGVLLLTLHHATSSLAPNP